MKTLICAAFASTLLASSVSLAGAPITFDGPMAKKHAGKFIFSTKPIPLDAKTEDGFTTSFTLKDKIFMRFWGSDTPENLNTKCRRERRVSYKVSVNDGKTGYMGVVRVGKTVSALSPTGDAKRPLTTKTVFGDKVTQKTHRFIREWNGYVIPRLKEGENKVKMWATIDCGYGQKTDPTIAEAEVKITVGKGDQAAYTKKFGPLLPKHQIKGGKSSCARSSR